MPVKLAYNTLEWGPTPELRTMLAEIKNSGWEGWEVRQPLNWLGSAARLNEIIDEAGLPIAAVCGQGSGMADDRVSLELNKRRIEFASETHADAFLFMAPPRPRDRTPTSAEILSFAAYAEDLSRHGAACGVDVTFHFHTGQLVHTEEEIRRVMDAAPSLQLCVDLSHAQLIGWDPHRCLREFSERLAYMHLQDYKAWRYVNIGEGDIFKSIPALFATIEAIGYNRWIACHGGLETDQTPLERARTCRAYLRSIGR